MKRLVQIFYSFFYKPFLKLYLRSDSTVSFDGFRLKVLTGVFHPRLFFSTKYFYSFIKKIELNSMNFLEIGSGSGILSLLAFKKGAKVSAVDIDPKAVENTRLNFFQNFHETANLSVLQSDVFSNLPQQKFDVIVINPPYYFKKVTEDSQQAWYCGENGEYFEMLFSGLRNYIHESSRTYMILEENCEIDRIKDIAKKYRFIFEQVEEKRIRWEKSYIFRLTAGLQY